MRRGKRSKKVVRATVSLPLRVFEELEELVKSGRYPSRSAAVCEAIRRLLQRELPLVKRRQQGRDERGS